MTFDPVQPFVLLDDAAAGRARLFTGACAVVRADTLAEVRPALVALRALGGNRAGFLSYEAGEVFDTSPFPELQTSAGQRKGVQMPLVWFARFDRVETLDAAGIDTLLGTDPADLGPVTPQIDRAAYNTMLARIAAYIAAGDTYQVNATFAATLGVRGHPLALYRRLRAAQCAAHGALIHTGRDWILSLSPELFFRLDGRALTTRPMKGTAPRGPDAATDDALAAALAADPKARAENLMIVDLLRNDLARVAEPGSVAVPALFAVERYPTVLQMTSTVTATARHGVDAVEVLSALFPCGSITGAPKLRAMQVIAEVEAGARGLYTGSIGAIGADGDATFNVAIRTLTLRGGTARVGLGGGIVADSAPDAEWTEALAKGAFLARALRPADLIETMRWSGREIAHRDLHLARLAASAAFLGHRLDLVAVETALAVATIGQPAARVRLLVARSGAVAVQLGPLPLPPSDAVTVALVPLPVAAHDWRLRHKTTDRGFYDAARRTAGTFEVAFVRPDNRLTEGSFTSLFVERDGRLLTPPLADSLLPGILRASLLAQGRAVEALLTAQDLGDGFLVGNAVRGLLRARLGSKEGTS